jgi:CubicO group peptidase (beta-lactamase class C family)
MVHGTSAMCRQQTRRHRGVAWIVSLRFVSAGLLLVALLVRCASSFPAISCGLELTTEAAKGGVRMAGGSGWERTSPGDQNPDEARLRVLTDDLAQRGTQALLVMRHDQIVWEWYAPGRDAHSRHYTASLAKALVGWMSLLVALSDGHIGIDDPACKHIPRWRGDAQRSVITVRHLATHSSGMEDAERGGKPHDQLDGWKGAFWRQDPDPFSIALDQTPVLLAPGTRLAYSNPGMAALAYAVTAGLRSAPQSDIRGLLRERIMEPIGVAAEEWEVGYGRSFHVDGMEVVPTWGGGNYTARAVARVGQLMLHKGTWEGPQLVPSLWVERMVSHAGTPRGRAGRPGSRQRSVLVGELERRLEPRPPRCLRWRWGRPPGAARDPQPGPDRGPPGRIAERCRTGRDLLGRIRGALAEPPDGGGRGPHNRASLSPEPADPERHLWSGWLHRERCHWKRQLAHHLGR